MLEVSLLSRETGQAGERGLRKLNKKECEVLNLGWSNPMHHCWLGGD